jgi:hypothetical protein
MVDRHGHGVLSLSKGAWVLGAVLLVLTFPARAEADVIEGTSGNDSLTGTSSMDTIWAYAGMDYASALNGNDTLHMGDGFDIGHADHGMTTSMEEAKRTTCMVRRARTKFLTRRLKCLAITCTAARRTTRSTWTMVMVKMWVAVSRGTTREQRIPATCGTEDD